MGFIRGLKENVFVDISAVYKGLGIVWASSLLGFLAAILCPFPWLFFFMGDKLRDSSELAVSESSEEC